MQYKAKEGSNDAIPSFSANIPVLKGSDQKSLPIHKPTGPIVPQGTGIFGTDKGHSDHSHPGDQAPSFHSVNTLLPGSNSEHSSSPLAAYPRLCVDSSVCVLLDDGQYVPDNNPYQHVVGPNGGNGGNGGSGSGGGFGGNGGVGGFGPNGPNGPNGPKGPFGPPGPPGPVGAGGGASGKPVYRDGDRTGTGSGSGIGSGDRYTTGNGGASGSGDRYTTGNGGGIGAGDRTGTGSGSGIGAGGQYRPGNEGTYTSTYTQTQTGFPGAIAYQAG